MGAGCGTRPKAAKAENDLTKAERDALVGGGTVRGRPARGVMPLCRKLAADHARRVRADRGREFEIDDLEGEALAAAVEAAKYYDPALGFAFTTFAGGYIRKALLTATDERHAPPVRGWPTEGDDGEPFDPADRDEHDPDDLDHFDYLDPDQRAAFDLLPDGRTKEVIRLHLAGFSVAQIGDQLGMPRKDVLLVVRNAIGTLRKAGLVPAELDPFPAERARHAELWEAEKVRNRAAADRRAERERAAAARRPAGGPSARERRRQESEAKRQARERECEYLARLADRVRPILAVMPWACILDTLADRLTAEGGGEGVHGRRAEGGRAVRAAAEAGEGGDGGGNSVRVADEVDGSVS